MKQLKTEIETTYSIHTVWSDCGEWSDSLNTLQDVIEYVVEKVRNQDDSSSFIDAQINVYSDNEEGFRLIANKTNNYSMQDFVIDLAQLSSDEKEKEFKTVLEWIKLLEDSLVALNWVED